MVGREFVHEKHRRSAAHLFEIEADIVARDGMRHFGFLLLSRIVLRMISSENRSPLCANAALRVRIMRPKFAGNALGGNEAASISFRHLTCA
jgi:hypothetical protein